MKPSLQVTPQTSSECTSWPGWLPLLLLPIIIICLRPHFEAWLFMWLLAFAIFAGLKWVTWWKARLLVPHLAWRSAAYLLGWPGMDAEAFLGGQAPASPGSVQWLWALGKTATGVLLLWVVVPRIPEQIPLLRGWTGMVGLILLLHFGSFHLLAIFWKKLGVDARPIMSVPIFSRSLSEFWGKRWNLGFRQLAYDLVFHPLHRRLGTAGAGFLVFAVSGLVHELVISLPARGGYGLPTGYFLLQGLAVNVERSRLGQKLGLRGGARGWFYTAVVTLGPAFWLFHPPFVLRVILPFMHAIKAL